MAWLSCPLLYLSLAMSAEKPLEPAALEWELDQRSRAEWAEALGRLPEVTAPALDKPPLVRVHGAVKQHSALMALNLPIRLDVMGPLGDYAFAFNRQADALVRGDVGHAVADGMRSGAVRIRGAAGQAAGVAMAGGTLAIYGNAGDRCGAGMCGGEIFVRGNVGDQAAVGAIGGTIVIGGNAGRGLGDAMNNATIFIRGSAASLGQDVAEAPLRERERLRLGLLLINASIRGDAKEFRRIIPQAVLDEERSRPRGEVNPSWR